MSNPSPRIPPPIQAGEVRNPTGSNGHRPKGLVERLRAKASEHRRDDPRGQTNADAYVAALDKKCREGDLDAIRFVFERLEGLPPPPPCARPANLQVQHRSLESGSEGGAP
jgi:hypothetical protein